MQIGDIIGQASGSDQLSQPGLGARLAQLRVTAIEVATAYRYRIYAPDRRQNATMFPHHAETGRQMRYPLGPIAAPTRRSVASRNLAYQSRVASSAAGGMQAIPNMGYRAPRRNEATDTMLCADPNDRVDSINRLKWGF